MCVIAYMLVLTIYIYIYITFKEILTENRGGKTQKYGKIVIIQTHRNQLFLGQ